MLFSFKDHVTTSPTVKTNLTGLVELIRRWAELVRRWGPEELQGGVGNVGTN